MQNRDAFNGSLCVANAYASGAYAPRLVSFAILQFKKYAVKIFVK